MTPVLPDEFPFSRKVESAEAAVAPAVVEEAAVSSAVTEAPAAVPSEPPAVVCVQEEALIEVASSGRFVYRGVERRRSPRQALRAKAFFKYEVLTKGNAPVQVVNISMLGVRFWSGRPIEVSDRGTMKMEVGPLKWSTKLRVVSCTQVEDEGWVVGCEFVGNELSRRHASAA